MRKNNGRRGSIAMMGNALNKLRDIDEERQFKIRY